MPAADFLRVLSVRLAFSDGPATPLGLVGRRVAARSSIYVGFASPTFGFANTIGDVGRRIAARPSIYVGFAS